MDEHVLYEKLKTLNEELWEGRVTRVRVQKWLSCFRYHPDGSDERWLALYLLSRFMYFGDREVRELLRAMYRDCFKYPIIAKIRKERNNTTDISTINEQYMHELRQTRFLGIGNPAESGTHLLYYFRQENHLPLDNFIETHDIVKYHPEHRTRTLRNPKIRRYVFIDDFCGSGTQAKRYSADVVPEIRSLANDMNATISIHYYVLFATADGLQRVKTEAAFDEVASVVEIDDSYRCFGPESRYFADLSVSHLREVCEEMCRRYGTELNPSHPLGFDRGQLLIAFHHNTPNNTLPIVWCERDENVPWEPIFRRYRKWYWTDAT